MGRREIEGKRREAERAERCKKAAYGLGLRLPASHSDCVLTQPYRESPRRMQHALPKQVLPMVGCLALHDNLTSRTSLISAQQTPLKFSSMVEMLRTVRVRHFRGAIHHGTVIILQGSHRHTLLPLPLQVSLKLSQGGVMNPFPTPHHIGKGGLPAHVIGYWENQPRLGIRLVWKNPSRVLNLVSYSR